MSRYVYYILICPKLCSDVKSLDRKSNLHDLILSKCNVQLYKYKILR